MEFDNQEASAPWIGFDSGLVTMASTVSCCYVFVWTIVVLFSTCLFLWFNVPCTVALWFHPFGLWKLLTHVVIADSGASSYRYSR